MKRRFFMTGVVGLFLVLAFSGGKKAEAAAIKGVALGSQVDITKYDVTGDGKKDTIRIDCDKPDLYNTGCGDDWKITIGKHVLIGPNVTLCTTGHSIHPKHRGDGMYSFPITIEDNVWIGANVVVLPDVTIGKNSVIGAGSVVTKDIPANSVAFGSPCKVFREINERDEEYYFKDRRFDEQPV